jgi:hypothetical protein
VFDFGFGEMNGIYFGFKWNREVGCGEWKDID